MTTVNCCWYSDQKAALVMKSGMNATTRERSSELMLLAGEDHDEVGDGRDDGQPDDDQRPGGRR